MKRFHVTLTEPERAKLEAIVTKRKADSQVVQRAFALLAADENQLQWLTDQLIQQTYWGGRVLADSLLLVLRDMFRLKLNRTAIL